MDSTAFFVVAILAISAQALLLFLALFEPTLRYKIARTPCAPLDSDRFLNILSTVVDAAIHRNTRIEVLTNGEIFYEAELEAIRNAKESINLEAYIFQKGEVTRRFIEALTGRAKAGVRVNIVLDAIGSFATGNRYFSDLVAAGGRVAWYHGFRPHTLPRINNRTHREILVVDCRVGFLGGAGFADHWLIPSVRRPRWRDSMYRIEGDAVSSLQAVFIENWLETTGELLVSDEYFCFEGPSNRSAAMIVDSAASSGQSTRARILFQMLLASSQETIEITTPYFLPDAGVRRELIRAIRDRGVRVRIICPGVHSDHLLTRRSSRRLYGELLRGGAEIYEYMPSMIHAKSLVIDGKWCAVGSTNFDHRSFSINDEVNLVSNDVSVASRLREDFARDLAASRGVSYDDWRRRSLLERLHEGFGRLLERQQ